MNFDMKIQKEQNTYNIGLALSGGGAKGFAHLGVLQALNEFGIYPDIISGTSAGAFAGVLYADGHKPSEIREFFKKKKFQEFAEFGIPSAGLFKSTKFYSFLEYYLKARDFSDLQLPFCAIATDIEEGRTQVFSEGNVIAAVVASCSVPIIFTPVEIDGHHYLDGGLLKNFPVSPIRDKCHIIIGVNVSPIRPLEYKNSLKYVIERSFHYMSASNIILDCELCDFLIESADLSEYSMFDLEHVDQIYGAGYTLAKSYIETHRQRLNKYLDEITINK